jgi:hypothetical protein
LVDFKNRKQTNLIKQENKMKTQNLFIMTALMAGLMACGSNDDAANPYPYQPGDNYNFSNNLNSGAFTNSEEWMVSQLQHYYGNVTVHGSVVLGNNTLPAGTHSWQTVMARIKQSADHFTNCRINTGFNQYQHIPTIARTDMTCLRSSLRNIAGQNLQNIQANYARDPSFNYNMLHTIDQLLSILSSSYSHMYQSWGYSYPINYQPIYWPGVWGHQNGAYLGVNYNSGSGLQIGGGFNWNF